MRAVIRDGRGAPRVEGIPRPAARPGYVLVETRASLLSAGTERATAEFASLSLAAKAVRRPDLVRQVLTKVRRDGVLETQRAVRARLDVADSLGYSCSGIVAEDATGFHPAGTLVACAGSGHAAHAEFNLVPKNLVVGVPVGVSAEHAAFATVGCVALHAVHTARVTLGEHVGVVGLGLIGQLAAQLLATAGCVVYGLDPVASRATLASELAGAHVATDVDALARLVAERTQGRGLDAVLITAASSDGGPIDTAAALARGRGRIVVLGDTPLTLDRRLFYEKELQLVVSRSYGPGRYDRAYEELGADYPYEYVRWTVQRNMEAFLPLVPRLQLDRLVTHRFAIADADRAYAILMGEKREPYLGIVITYPERDVRATQTVPLVAAAEARRPRGRIGVSLVGAGTFARSTLLPALANLRDIELGTVVTAKGISAWDAGRRFGFTSCSTDLESAMGPETHLVVVATRHSQHARLVCELLARGKAVFVEKPLCVSEDELEDVVAAWRTAPGRPFLMVGYNRRFALLVTRLRQVLGEAGRPLVLQYRVNAGALAAGHWLRDPDEGGGRVVGEACHFVDLLCELGGAPVRRVFASRPGAGGSDVETFSAMLELANGSLCTLAYSADGDAAHPKERLEVIGGGLVAVLDDFRTLTATHRGRRQRWRTWGRDKGHLAELRATVEALGAGADAPIPMKDLVAGMRAVFAIQRSLATGVPVEVESA